MVAACVGIIGSLFFAIGIVRQSVSAMANLSGTYFDWNPHMVPALAAQKADYVFGGCIIVLAFGLQLASFLVPADAKLPFTQPAAVPWVAAAATIVGFFTLHLCAKRLALRYEAQIQALLKSKQDETKRQLEERKKARPR
jgi:hypothetical protein